MKAFKSQIVDLACCESASWLVVEMNKKKENKFWLSPQIQTISSFADKVDTFPNILAMKILYILEMISPGWSITMEEWESKYLRQNWNNTKPDKFTNIVYYWKFT